MTRKVDCSGRSHKVWYIASSFLLNALCAEEIHHSSHREITFYIGHVIAEFWLLMLQ